jgi:hypothetical protein
MFDLQNIEAIKQLKHRYFRALDSKNWELMSDCLSKDCIAKYDGGKYSFEGREKIVQFFSSYMSNPQLIFMHHGHHPEITIVNDQQATGIWYLQDIVINLDNNTTLRGAGFYHDTYIYTDKQWLISETGYERTFEEIEKRTDTTMNFNRFAKASV